jgi:hypothetical protein
MTEYYDLLSTNMANQPNLSKGARLKLYDRGRKAMLDRLSSISPPLSNAEIESEAQGFDRAVARLERDFADKDLAFTPPDGPVLPARDAASKRQRPPRAKGAYLRDAIGTLGIVAILALCVVRASHPLPGNLQIRVRWDQLLASPSRAETAPQTPTVSLADATAIDTAATSGAMRLARLAAAAPHDVDLSHLPRPVKRVLHAGEKRLKNYRLRDVFAEFALVEAPHGILLVKQGSDLENLGRVTAIEQRDQEWVVVTTAGTILN